jgi:polysaccharide chain length determinant protein (PEP-CTERM system associated)
MNEVYAKFISYLNSIWRRRWYVIAISWFLCGAGWTFVASMPDKYDSHARIYVDMDTMLGPLMRGLAVQTNLFQQIDVMHRTLLSRPNLEKVILMTDLDLGVHTDEARETLIESLRQRIRLRQQGQNLFNVAFSDTDPAMAKRVVQAVLQIFVEGNLGASRKDMDSARRFLDDQIRDYEQQLAEAETRLADFKRKNMGFLPGGGNYYSQMQRMRAQIEKSAGQLGEAVSLRDELSQQLTNVPEFQEVQNTNSVLSGAIENPGTGPQSETQIRILEIEAAIDELLTRYTRKHPDVAAAQRRLDALNKQLDIENASAAPTQNLAVGNEPSTAQAAPQVSLIPSPVHEQIKLQIVQQEATIAALQRRLAKEREEAEKWSNMAGLVPRVEAELTRLDRDYEIVKRNYEQLRERKESAKLAQDLETKAQKVQFRVIDPPKVPIKPSGPNRPLFLTIVLLAGVAGGIGFAFVLVQINSTFTNIQALREKFTLPVLGSVSAIMSTRERRRLTREHSGFAFVAVSLIIAFGGLQAIENLGAKQLLEFARGLGIV